MSMFHSDLPGGRAIHYFPIPLQEGGCLVKVQEDALEKKFGLEAKVGTSTHGVLRRKVTGHPLSL